MDYPMKKRFMAEDLLKSYTKSDTMALANKLGLFDADPELKEAGLVHIKDELAHYLTFPVQLRRI
jgi:hypothetical protein